jgi:Polyphosphate kinase 2 (PPK2)
MSRRERITKELLVEPGTEANIAGRDPAWTGGPEFEQLSATELSHTAKALLADGVQELADAQELLWASDTNALLVVFQALDAAGKDSTIKHVMSGVNPQGVQVVSFKQPSSEELDHDFLWRAAKALPERGRIGISTAPTTRRSSPSGSTPSGWRSRSSRLTGAGTASGPGVTRTSTPSSATSTATGPRS